MQLSYALRYLLGIFFLLVSFITQAQTVSFTVTNGAEERCAVDSLVNISIEPNPNLTLTEITLSWGDDTPVTKILPGEPLERSHTYPGPNFLEECNYSSECIDLGLLGFCFDVKVIARYSNSSTENVTKTLTFQTPPRPNFNANLNPICVDEMISFNNQTCPNNDSSTKYTWELPTGEKVEEFEIGTVFTDAGTVQVILTAENRCGTNSTTETITVQDLPVALSAIDSGSVSFTNNTYRVCLGGGGLVRLNSDSSMFAENYRWSISSGSGIEWVESQNKKITRLHFNQPGMYTIMLEVDNGCNNPSQTSFDVEVLDSSSLSLVAQPNVCLSLDY